ncbi:biotin--[acetyl-CoA-carboxylase] ligase [uncultured Polaribacter sp.]|uniref:biotin--[acetyl-CoA-carboxylase] ligase n=1 Tax=uncultured Polaribacter sp. TaxID=174711 RepID=UPI002636A161|nr:biotin--[acetyl-CoA-carboxylase] ligase [uncultured Polaribacter sp.]
MKIIKLNAIDSTNSFLKDLVLHSDLENYYTVVTHNQTNGRGQQHSKWVSKPFKNLTFSTFIELKNFNVKNKKYFNFAVALAVFDTLTQNNIHKISIKWPNDIMSANRKICGILIENTFIGSHIKNSVVGIGLNINQETFPNFLPDASSMKLETGIHFNLDYVLEQILNNLKKRINTLEALKFQALEKDYLNVLYKKNIPTMFKNNQDINFMGKIIGISSLGNLVVELEDETIKEFGVKEITFL